MASAAVAWYGDMALGKHLLGVLGLGRSRVVVVFHRPFEVSPDVSRKELADRCRGVVADGLTRALMGRLPELAGATPEEAKEIVRKVTTRAREEAKGRF